MAFEESEIFPAMRESGVDAEQVARNLQENEQRRPADLS